MHKICTNQKWIPCFVKTSRTPCVLLFLKCSHHCHNSRVAESPKGKEKSGGMAYEVILKPAAGDSPAPRPKSPPKERPLSQEVIDKKLKEAEERRLVSGVDWRAAACLFMFGFLDEEE